MVKKNFKKLHRDYSRGVASIEMWKTECSNRQSRMLLWRRNKVFAKVSPSIYISIPNNVFYIRVSTYVIVFIYAPIINAYNNKLPSLLTCLMSTYTSVVVKTPVLHELTLIFKIPICADDSDALKPSYLYHERWEM